MHGPSVTSRLRASSFHFTTVPPRHIKSTQEARMALAIGKRKRRQDVSNASNKDANDSDDDAAARALFQRAFEKKFKPLEKDEKDEKAQKSSSEGDEEVDDEEDSDESHEEDLSGSGGEDDDFSGFSSDNSDSAQQSTQPRKPQIEIIEDKTYQRPDRASEKRLKKGFMSSRVPSQQQQSTHKSTATTSKETDKEAPADDDSTNLQNDLALQRLLKESHLLDPTTFSATGTASSAPEGAARLRAFDMRMRDLGGKKSHLDQEKMPIAFRKGMVAKAGEREGKRRTEAKENGVILERFGGEDWWWWS